jgi:hypothetical protein
VATFEQNEQKIRNDFIKGIVHVMFIYHMKIIATDARMFTNDFYQRALFVFNRLFVVIIGSTIIFKTILIIKGIFKNETKRAIWNAPGEPDYSYL